MASNLFPVANLSQYNETVNGAGELVITCKSQGINVAQTIPAPAPCVLFFDPISTNFFIAGLTGFEGIPSTVQFVKIVQSVDPSVQVIP